MAFRLRSQTPLKQTYKKDTDKFKDFDVKNDTLIKGNSMDMEFSSRIGDMNASNAALKLSGKNSGTRQGAEPKSEKLFRDPDGSYTSMKVYNKENLKNSIK
jgi:hypothetical protein